MSRQDMRERSRLKRELLNGTRYTSLVVVEPVWHEQRGSWAAKCLCDCGKEITARYDELERGGTKSCGCYSRFMPTHGSTNSEEYKIWANILYRCQTPTAPNYHRYGGRGITVCDRWQKFENFIEDMGERPYPTASVDRINNNGNYEPLNCKWASKKEQANNTRSTKLLTFNGQTMCTEDWGVFVGGSKNLVRSRLKNGWSIERALTTPPVIKYCRKIK